MSKWLAYAGGASVSWMGAGITATLLLGGSVHDIAGLAAAYFAYSFFVVATLHCVAFGVPLWSDLRLTKRLPKYLEYGYLVLISLSLFDIVNFAPRYSLYLQSVNGDAASLEKRITASAQSDLQNYCGKGTEHASSSGVYTEWYYSNEYCRKLAALATARDIKAAILKAAQDKQFMDYVVARDVTSANDQPDVTEFKNPIAGLLDQAATLAKFETYTEQENRSSEAMLKWLSLLLLPIGLGIRALKTSLELFADLK